MKKRLTAALLAVLLILTVTMTAIPAAALSDGSDTKQETPTFSEIETEALPRDDEPVGEAPTQAPEEPATEVPADGELTLSKTSLTLGEGEVYTLAVSGANSAVTWSSDSSAVSVTDNGDGTAAVKAEAVGEAAVTAVTMAGGEVSCAVAVKPMAASLTLNKTSLTLGVGEEYDLDSYVPKGTAAYFRIYASSDPSVASAAESGGIVKAESVGTAEIICAMQNGIQTACTVTVLPMAESLTLNKTSLTLGVGEEYDLDSYVPAGTAAYFRTYASSKPSVAFASASGGIVKAKAAGTADITCTLENGVQVKCVVTVKPMAKSLSLNKTSITLGIGEEYDLDSYAPSGYASYYRIYSSSKSSVATVAAGGGIVKAKAAGTANIYCTLPNGVSAKCVVTVKPMAQSLSLNKTYVRLRIGAKYDLDSYAPSGTAAYYRYYSSDNPSVAKVTKADGIVTAVSEGKATVTCKLLNGKYVQCEVRVMSAADSLSEKNGIIVNLHGHDDYSGEDVWGKGTPEASVVDWMIGNWACCSYFEGNATWRCAEWGRYVRNTRAASQSTTNYSDLTMTPANIRKIAKGCLPGTTMSFGPQYVPSHMIVLLRVTDDHIWWADCNWNWDNRIHYREASLEEFVNFVHWLPTPNKNGYIVSITKINRLNTFSKPNTSAARYLNRGDARIVWTKVDGAKSYEVYQVTGSGDKLVSTQTSTSYTNSKSTPGTKYTYYVKAVMSNNKKITGNTVSVYGRIHCPNLELDRANKCIKWNAVEGASGYRIFRRSGISGSFKHITTVKGTTYKDSVMNFKAGEYDNSSYRIQAVSSKGESASSVYSDIVAVTQEYCMP